MNDHDHDAALEMFGRCPTCMVGDTAPPAPPEPEKPVTLFDDPESVARDVEHARPGRARTDDPASSKQAAANVSIHSGTQRAAVLACFARFRTDGLTGDDLCAHLGDRNGSSWRSRMAELRDDYDPPLLERDGTQRETRGGDLADVHRITAAGWRVLDHLTDEPRT